MAANPRANIKRVKDGVDEIKFKLELISARLEDPEPALYTIAEEFSLMEASRFKNGGSAPAWGITDKWKPISAGYKNDVGDNFASTVAERSNKGGNKKNQPLVNHGYLAAAAVDPQFEPFGSKGLNLIIDPSNRAPADYSNAINYGAFHQDGNGIGGRGNPPPKRQFVTITPEFLVISKKIVEYFLLDGVAQKKRAKEFYTPMDRAAGKHARQDRSQIRRKATISDKKFGSITRVQNFGEGGVYRSTVLNTFKTPRTRKS